LQNIVTVAAGPAAVSPAKADVQIDTEAAMGDERNLVLRFWGLASSQRREISENLDLLAADEMDLPEPERYGRALMRAGQKKLLGSLADQIEQMEKR
jgi:hypothetical protein